jgi:hypothetical protein
LSPGKGTRFYGTNPIQFVNRTLNDRILWLTPFF